MQKHEELNIQESQRTSYAIVYILIISFVVMVCFSSLIWFEASKEFEFEKNENAIYFPIVVDYAYKVLISIALMGISYKLIKIHSTLQSIRDFSYKKEED